MAGAYAQAHALARCSVPVTGSSNQSSASAAATGYGCARAVCRAKPSCRRLQSGLWRPPASFSLAPPPLQPHQRPGLAPNSSSGAGLL
jgi:hypothetical protein